DDEMRGRAAQRIRLVRPTNVIERALRRGLSWSVAARPELGVRRVDVDLRAEHADDRRLVECDALKRAPERGDRAVTLAGLEFGVAAGVEQERLHRRVRGRERRGRRAL